MIVFSGEFSEESKRYVLKQNARIGLLVSSILALIATVIVVTIAIIYSLWLILLFLIIFALLVVLATLTPYIQRKRILKLIVPSKIVINKEGGYIRIYFRNTAAIVEQKLSKIKKVIDEGKHYYIKLKFPKIDGFLCQKDLLEEGTNEEFEEVFQRKMIRKRKNE